MTRIILIAAVVLVIVVMLAVLLAGRRKSTPASQQEEAGTSQPLQPAHGEIDYNVYVMTPKEKSMYLLGAAAALFGVGFVFYQNVLLALLITPLALLYPRLKTKAIIKQRKEKISLHFNDMLYAVASSLGAGKSVEMAFKESLKDLALLHGESGSDLMEELRYLIRKIEMNVTVEEALFDLAKRTHVEEIQSFADVFHTCKRTGGDVVEVIRNTSKVIGEKIEFKNELNTMLSQRQFEQKMLSVIPIVLILLLSWFSGDYMEPVFTTVLGRIVMTVAIVLMLAANVISGKIIDIEV